MQYSPIMIFWHLASNILFKSRIESGRATRVYNASKIRRARVISFPNLQIIRASKQVYLHVLAANSLWYNPSTNLAAKGKS